MDIRRTVIVLGLLVVGYFLVVAWNEDYGKKPQEYAQSTVSPTDAPAIPTSSDTPQATQVNTDLPSLDELSPIELSPSRQALNLIQVETDVLQVKINPRGGDIVALDLPAYPLGIEDNLKDQPFQLLESSERRLYQTQSGLIGRDGWDKDAERPLYQVSNTSYRLDDTKEELVVELTATRDQVTLIKRYRFKRGEYLVSLEYEIQNQSSAPLSVNLYAQLKRDRSIDPSQQGGMGMQSYLGAALSTQDELYKKVDFDDLDDGSFKEGVQGGWVGFLQHYFLVAWLPMVDVQHTYRLAKSGNYYLFGYYDSAVSVPTGETKILSTSLYAGPKDQNRLSELADPDGDYRHEGLDLSIDYGWLFWVAKPLFWGLEGLHKLFNNWGWSIIFLTLFIKAMFFPLSKKSYTSMAKMRKVAPKLQEIKERYGDDRQQLSMKMMELYRKEQINPLNGCLPILVQMPVFIALYWVLMESVELRQAPWLGWIQDLSAMDPYFILPILMGASMLIQMKLQPTPPDPVQANVMKIMPWIFTVFFLFFPAGLVLYWLVNNLLSIAQQWWINKTIEQESGTLKKA